MKPKKNIQEYKESLKQNWTQNYYSSIYSDQFGMVIHYGERYKLEHNGIHVITVYSLAAAKEISLIYLNDLILNNPPDTNTR